MKEPSTSTPPASARACSPGEKPIPPPDRPPACPPARPPACPPARLRNSSNAPTINTTLTITGATTGPIHGTGMRKSTSHVNGEGGHRRLPQPEVVGDIPDTEADAEDQEPVPPVRAGQHGNAKQHHQGRGLPADLDRDHVGRQ